VSEWYAVGSHLLKIGIYQPESVKSINLKIKLQILNSSPGIVDDKLNI